MGRTTTVGTGQTLGTYDGPQVYFMDQNNNGVLDFTRPGVGNVTSARYVFDPERDVALEPYVVADARLRVSEARLPYNSYWAKDTAPEGIFHYDANGEPDWLQVSWITNQDVTNPNTIPPTSGPMNIVTAFADAAGVDENRTFDWRPVQPTPLTSATAPLAQNGPLDIYADDSGGYRALWVSTERGAGGLRSEIRYEQPSGSGVIWTGRELAEGVRGLFDPDQANAGANKAHWTFWHTGLRGHERPMFSVQSEATGQVVAQGELPIDNSISPADPATTVDTLYDSDGLGPGPSNPITLRKSPHGPFTAVKDLSPMLYTPSVVYAGGTDTQPMIRVFFAGYAKHLGNFDIYEVRFNRHDLLTGQNNNGKIEFQHVMSGSSEGGLPEGLPALNPSIAQPGPPPGTGPVDAPGDSPGEEFTADAMRQEFHSRHPDWVTGSNFLNAGGPGVSFTLGVKQHHTDWQISYYDVVWGPARPERGEMYDEKRGVYKVIPRFRRHTEDGLFTDLADWQWPNGPAAPQAGTLPNVRYYPGTGPAAPSEYELIDPTTYTLPDAEKRPLMMEIDPVLGRVRFSAPLFNILNPFDQSTVLSENFAPLANMDDVFLCGTYSPFIWRHTLSPADDDVPCAILQSGAWNGNDVAGTHAYRWPAGSHSNRILLYWRRSFGAGQAPYYGRTCYMMKMQSWTIRVNHPPIIGDLDVGFPGPVDPPGPLVGPGTPEEIVVPLPPYPGLPPGSYGGNRAEYDADMANGEIAIWRGVFRWVQYPNGDQRRSSLHPGSQIRVQYRYQYLDDAGNIAQSMADELHRIGGWSQETIIPIDSVLSEGPLRVSEETYTVPAFPGSADRVVARRYWVFWSSPRPIYDLRLAGAGGSIVRQSSDIFYCTLQPEFPTLVRERLGANNAKDRFRPSLPYP